MNLTMNTRCKRYFISMLLSIVGLGSINGFVRFYIQAYLVEFMDERNVLTRNHTVYIQLCGACETTQILRLLSGYEIYLYPRLCLHMLHALIMLLSKTIQYYAINI